MTPDWKDISVGGCESDVIQSVTKMLAAEAQFFPVEELDYLPWFLLRKLEIQCFDRHLQARDIRDRLGIRHGGYYDAQSHSLLLICPPLEMIGYYVERCIRSLKTLHIHNTAIEHLDVSQAESLRTLDLSHNPQLNEVCDLHELLWLDTLRLSHSNLGPVLCLGRLPRLRYLNINNSHVTHLDILGPMERMENLQACRCWLEEVEFIRYFPNLQNLAVTSCRISQLPSLDQHQKLKVLRIAANPIHSLDHVAFPQSLTSISLRKLPLRKIPEQIRELKHLEGLKLAGMELDELPDWLPELGLNFNHTKFGSGINLQGTKVAGVDMTIFDQPYETILQWFRDRKVRDGSDLNEVKVIFLGDGESGKTHTIARLLNDGSPVDFHEDSTPGIVITNRDYDLEDRRVQVHYWDFGGQEILHSMHRIFLTGRTLYVVLLNARDNTQNDRARYWLHNIRSFANEAPVLLVLNKMDQNSNASINENDLRAMYPALCGVVKLSTLEDPREEFNKKLTDNLLAQIAKMDTIRTFFPARWKKVKDELENMDEPYIFGDRYQQLCARAQVAGDQQADLLKLFKTLGVSFYYDGDTLEDYVVLRPDWITNAIYTILFNKQEDTHNGILPHHTIYRLLKPAANDGIKRVDPNVYYKSHEVKYVLDVLRNFRLSYQMKGEEEFIPMLCDSNSLAVAAEYANDPETLEFQMEYEYLPNNVLHRLMVDLRGDLATDQVWLTGAQFVQRSTGLSAVVKSEGNVIRIFVRSGNPMHRPNTYLSIIKDSLDRINTDMGLRPSRNQVVYKDQGIAVKFDYDELLDMLECGENSIFSRPHRGRIPIRNILNQTAWGESRDQENLLHDLAAACLQLQGHRIYWDCDEDTRNTYVRDALRNMRYLVNDQTFQGQGSGRVKAGELDLEIRREYNIPWTVCEALNLEAPLRKSDGDIKKPELDKWNNHLDKLLENYNPNGLPFLFLLSYTECSRDDFPQVFRKFSSHIQTYRSGAHAIQSQSESPLGCAEGEQPHNIRCIKATYDRSGCPTVVYHIFLQLGE